MIRRPLTVLVVAVVQVAVWAVGAWDAWSYQEPTRGPAPDLTPPRFEEPS
jgi:hypothetical protein